MKNPVFDAVRELLDRVEATQTENIDRAAELIAETYRRGGILQAYGVGHSDAGASEICNRAGGFIPTKKLREPSQGLYQDIPGAGAQFMKRVDIRPEDTLVLISNSGRNTMIIEIAQAARAKGASIVVVTSLEASKRLTPKHKDGKNLYAYGDVVLDNQVGDGDATLEMPGLDTKICGMSSITTATLLQAMVYRAAEKLVESGVQPPIYKSMNIDGGPEYNQTLLEQYEDRLNRI